MTDNVNNPDHYVKASITIQPIELTARLDSCLGQALQYVMRAPYKGNEVEDLKKAIVYLEKSIVIGIDLEKYTNPESAVYVLASLFVDKTNDKLTKMVLMSLFFKENLECFDMDFKKICHQQLAIGIIEKRLKELESE